VHVSDGGIDFEIHDDFDGVIDFEVRQMAMAADMGRVYEIGPVRALWGGMIRWTGLAPWGVSRFRV